jgi:ribonuclease J
MAGTLRVLPLGGLGEIGKNMTVVEYGGRIVVVDTGLMFPTAEMLGIDLVLPDFSYLRDRAGDIEAIVLTHGHEDHVGALPYVLREIGEPPVIYGGMLTIAMVRSKLDEHKLSDAPLKDLPAGEVVRLGPFEMEMVHLSHSIPDARGVVLSTELGSILLTGDYKFDQTPVDGRPADISRLAELGRDGLLLLCGDSTNADRPGIAPSESSVGPALLETFRGCEGRIIVTSFASNIHRVQQAIDAAVELDRRVALVGRSMRKNFNIASSLGIAEAPSGLFIQPREIEDFPDEKVIVISTGSQGEPLSALRRMANNDHRDVELRRGDTVVFSATPVPGNERAVNETIDRIHEIGASVVTAKDAPIHASGHGWQEELKLMLNLTKPRRSGWDRGREDLPGPQRAAARDRRRRRPLWRGHPRRSRLRRRRQRRRAGRRRPPRPARDLRRRDLHRRRHRVGADRGVGRRPGGDLPRRPVRRAGRPAARGHSTRGRALAPTRGR